MRLLGWNITCYSNHMFKCCPIFNLQYVFKILWTMSCSRQDQCLDPYPTDPDFCSPTTNTPFTTFTTSTALLLTFNAEGHIRLHSSWNRDLRRCNVPSLGTFWRPSHGVLILFTDLH